MTVREAEINHDEHETRQKKTKQCKTRRNGLDMLQLHTDPDLPERRSIRTHGRKTFWSATQEMALVVCELPEHDIRVGRPTWESVVSSAACFCKADIN